ncbi:acetyltransferase [Flavobacterium sp.]|uniref:acetyltransferase n=1 Tax=Flavobacterium sp. TaxID=239 RepID=UPI00286A202F|nr:acetyltransferase [Flavobacterium sp.]
MKQNKNDLISELIKLSNQLDTQYNLELNFRNHCYLRIAYDNTVNSKWGIIIKRPFTKYASDDQLKNALTLLSSYLLDKVILLSDNEKSLAFRKTDNNSNVHNILNLFE